MESQNIVTRVKILGVPVDILPENKIGDLVDFLDDGKNHQVILLSLWDLLRARRSGEFRTMVAGARLVLPISLAITRAARFLKRQEPVRYMPFDFTVKLLSALERRGKSAYLLGSSRTTLQKAEANLRSTFPGLRIVGRFAGRYPKAVEPSIIEAVRKATPNLLLVGRGVPGRERWIPRNLPRFNAGIYMWCSDLFEVFAEKRTRPPKALFNRGLEWIVQLLRRPYRIWHILPYMWFKLLLLIARIRGE